MFFKRKKYNEPVDFIGEIVIQASAETIFEALNFRAPNNRYWRRGMTLTPVAGTQDQFDLMDPRVPDMVFHLTELKAEAPLCYEVRTEFPGGEPLGVLLGDESAYLIEPINGELCRVRCTINFKTVPLTRKERETEIPMLAIAVNDDLARLKTLLESDAEEAQKAGALDDVLDLLENHMVCAAE